MSTGRLESLARLKERNARTPLPGHQDVQEKVAPLSHAEAPSEASSNPELIPSEKTVTTLGWECSECQRECIPIRTESRCLCGHRFREHGKGSTMADFGCCRNNCKCKGFFFIVAEGSWVLRCRCKHKHTDHSAADHSCMKEKCACKDFSSPWVCNCNHPWASHKQVLVERKVRSLEALMAGVGIVADPTQVDWTQGPASEINRWDLINRGVEENQP